MILSSGFIILFFTCVAPIIYSQSTGNSSSVKGIGKSACVLHGDFTYDDCKLDSLLCDQLPPECSSYIFVGATVDLKYNVQDIFGPEHEAHLLKILQCTKIPVFIYYGYRSFSLWSLILACNGADGLNVKTEVEGLKAYLNKRKGVSGILLNNFDVIPKQKSFENYSQNFKSYVTSLKQLMPELAVCIILFADEIQMHLENPVVQWIDFKEVIDILDCVVISFEYFNKCGNDFIRGGIVPITGNAKYTMEKTQALLDKMGIKKEKLYFRYELITEVENSEGSYCVNSIPLMCKKPKDAVKWCSDTITTFYEKGVYANKHGSGFVGSHVDMDDVHCDCQCGRSFPAFYAILDGFKGASMPPPCPLLDRCV